MKRTLRYGAPEHGNGIPSPGGPQGAESLLAAVQPAAREASAGRSRTAVSVAIVSWNVREALRECLRALRAEGSGCLLETTVVDNASADGTAECVAAEFPEVRLVRNDANLGFARACNQALRTATAPYCCLLNPDTRVTSGALAVLANFLEEHPEVGAAGPQLLNPDGSLQPNGGPFPGLTGTLLRVVRASALFRRWYDRHYRWGRDDLLLPARVDQVSGACLALRREALDQVGWLDERFFLYYEEVDWLLRARQAGWSTHYVPEARVTHRWGASTSQLPEACLRHLARSEYLYFRKHRPAWLHPVAWALTRAEMATHLAARRRRVGGNGEIRKLGN
jgi:N-acetylglucosaminyl-diphospho-decaprenol L-rhamnosyltransferase